MANNSTINVNVPSDVKEKANNLFNNLGISMSSAINIFLRKAIFENGIPFDVKQPEHIRAGVFDELDYMEKHPEKYKVYHNVDEMFEDISNEKI